MTLVSLYCVQTRFIHLRFFTGSPHQLDELVQIRLTECGRKEETQKTIIAVLCQTMDFFCNAASNVRPYGLFWQPALYVIHRYYIFVY